MTTDPQDGQPDAVTFSRLARRGMLLGLSAGQVATLGAGLVVLVGGLVTGDAAGATWTAPLWGGAILLALLRRDGRPLAEWLPRWMAWTWRRASGRTTHTTSVLRPRPTGRLHLPGDPSPLDTMVDPDSGAVLVHDPASHLLVAVARVSHRAFVLQDPADQQRRVHGWGRVLAGAARSTGIARIQVLEQTLPDHGEGLADWWARHGIDDGSWVAGTYRELLAAAGPTGERHLTTISLALDLRQAASQVRAAGGGLAGAARVLHRDMTALGRALATADLAPVQWLGSEDLTGLVRTAYDPHLAGGIDHAGNGRLADAGPMAMVEDWDTLRADSAWHAVLWISEWPRTAVHPGFLAPLVLSGGVRRAFSLVCQPVPTDRATREVRRRKTEHLADTAQRTRLGQVTDVRDTAEYHDVLQQEADLAAGHALVRYTGLLAVSAPTRDTLDAAVADIEQAAIQASRETRRLVGQQARAFAAAALPLCRHV